MIIIEDLIYLLFSFLDSCLKNKTVSNEVTVPVGLELKGFSKENYSSIQEKISLWSQGEDAKYLEFKVLDKIGLYIRLNKSHFNFSGNQIVAVSPEAFSFYHRKRKAGRKHAKMTLICYFLRNGLSEKIQHHLDAVPVIKALEKLTDDTYRASQSSIPTLKEFLPTYESIMYSENPDTYKTRVQLIKNQFSHFYDIPVNQIRGADLLEFTKSFRKNRTAIEIQEGASPYIVEESTMKGYVGGIRGLLRRASTYSNHPFDLCESLYCKALSFKIDNESDQYLTLDEIKNLINDLADRDESKYKKSNRSVFSDYLTPFMLLSLATGLRPKYALKLKWSDLNFENMQLIVRADKGKIGREEYCDLTDDAILVLKEWKKHIIHRNSSNNWVFPSPQNPAKHLTSYKTTFTRFRVEYRYKDLIMYKTRHSFGTHYTSAYQSLRETQAALHQKCSKSTKRYARYIPSNRKKGMKAFDKLLPSFAVALNR
jgi:integrase